MFSSVFNWVRNFHSPAFDRQNTPVGQGQRRRGQRVTTNLAAQKLPPLGHRPAHTLQGKAQVAAGPVGAGAAQSDGHGAADAAVDEEKGIEEACAVNA